MDPPQAKEWGVYSKRDDNLSRKKNCCPDIKSTPDQVLNTLAPPEIYYCGLSKPSGPPMSIALSRNLNHRIAPLADTNSLLRDSSTSTAVAFNRPQSTVFQNKSDSSKSVLSAPSKPSEIYYYDPSKLSGPPISISSSRNLNHRIAPPVDQEVREVPASDFSAQGHMPSVNCVDDDSGSETDSDLGIDDQFLTEKKSKSVIKSSSHNAPDNPKNLRYNSVGGVHYRIFNDRLMDMMPENVCNAECVSGRKCLKDVRASAWIEARHHFWGTKHSEPLTNSAKYTKLHELVLKNGGRSRDRKQIEFLFDGQIICEDAWLFIMGFTHGDRTNVSQASNTYAKVRNEIFFGGLSDRDKKCEAKETKGIFETHHRDVCEYFLLIESDPNSCDSIPTKEGSLDGKMKNIYVLPYDTSNCLYEHFEMWFNDQTNIDAVFNNLKKVPSKTTFLEVLRDALDNGILLRQEDFEGSGSRRYLKMLGCKGSFPTCEICNKINNMLRTGKIKIKPKGGNSSNSSTTIRWNKAERSILLKYKKIHLLQQAHERKMLSQNVMEALEDDDRGNPKMLIIEPDGMTKLKGTTPKEGVHNRSKQSYGIENRLIGVRVICGSQINCFIYISVDQTIPGGSNLFVDVYRTAIDEVSKLLKAAGKLMPSKILLQADNCGDNKNKEIFGFASLLVEIKEFKEILINFLIVGHTHCYVDQVFSVIANKIRKSEWIGSPLAMHELYSIAHEDQKFRDNLILVQLLFIHDWKTLLEPFINKNLKYYQIPFVFRITLRCNRAVMQYKMLHSSLKWNPEPPSFKDYAGESFAEINADDYPIEICSESLKDTCAQQIRSELKITGYDLETNFQSQQGVAASFEQVQKCHNEMMWEAVANQMARMDLEGDSAIEFEGESVSTMLNYNHQDEILNNGATDIYDDAYKAAAQKLFNITNTTNQGYIVWLMHGPGFATLKDQRPNMLPNASQPTKRTLLKAAEIASTASIMLNRLQTDIYSMESDSAIEATQDFKLKILTSKEIEYFKQRESQEKVLNIIAMAQLEALKTPWAIITKEELTAVQIDRAESEYQDRLVDSARFAQRSEAFCQRQGTGQLGISGAAEVIARFPRLSNIRHPVLLLTDIEANKKRLAIQENSLCRISSCAASSKAICLQCKKELCDSHLSMSCNDHVMLANSTGGWRETIKPTKKKRPDSVTCVCGGKFNSEASKIKHIATKKHKDYKAKHPDYVDDLTYVPPNQIINVAGQHVTIPINLTNDGDDEEDGDDDENGSDFSC